MEKSYDPEAIVREMRQEYFRSLEEEREESLSESDLESCLAFRLGSYRLALVLHELRAVIRLPRYSKLPLAPPSLLGMINFRGEVLPLLDLHSFFEEEQKGDEKTLRVLVLPEKVLSLAFLVDEVLDICEFAPEKLQEPTKVQGKVPPETVRGILEMKGSPFLLLKGKEFFQYVTKETGLATLQ